MYYFVIIQVGLLEDSHQEDVANEVEVGTYEEEEEMPSTFFCLVTSGLLL